MALKNKDGTVYKLQGPNPVMRTQALWGDYTLHNMKWTAEVYANTMGQKAEPTPEEKSFVEELESTKSDPVPEKQKEDGIRIITPTPKNRSREEDSEIRPNGKLVQQRSEVHEDLKVKEEERDKSEDLVKTFVHCLPATVKTKRDNLYGEVYSTVKYGEPYSFEGVVVNESDVHFELWTDAEISLQSILYPKANSKRWWKVKKAEQKSGGLLLYCLPSDFQPSFNS